MCNNESSNLHCWNYWNQFQRKIQTKILMTFEEPFSFHHHVKSNQRFEPWPSMRLQQNTNWLERWTLLWNFRCRIEINQWNLNKLWETIEAKSIWIQKRMEIQKLNDAYFVRRKKDFTFNQPKYLWRSICKCDNDNNCNIINEVQLHSGVN
jgi:hypothetical protein